MRVLVLGGGGQVARAVTAQAPAGHTVVARTRGDLDISDEAAVMAAMDGQDFSWVVNGAAYTAVDLAETEPGAAEQVNDLAVGVVARCAARSGVRLLHLSTDFVFDGKANRAYLPDAAAAPLSVYGLSKLAGERQALSLTSDALILRTAWVYASTGKNFALTMLRLMREKPEVRVVSDQFGTPTWATGISRAVWSLIGAGASGGIYHWTDLGVASWYDFAVAIQDEAFARSLLTRKVPMIPISTAAYRTPAARPAFSVLDTTATRAIVDFPAQHWRHHLGMMLDELRTP